MDLRRSTFGGNQREIALRVSGRPKTPKGVAGVGGLIENVMTDAPNDRH
jgi:hypothetical protein